MGKRMRKMRIWKRVKFIELRKRLFDEIGNMFDGPRRFSMLSTINGELDMHTAVMPMADFGSWKGLA